MKSKPVLGLEDVRTMAAAAEREALANGWAVTIAIVDDGGHLLWLQRLDDAPPISAQIAPGKARTAALGRRESRLYEETINQGRTSFLSAPGLEAMLEGGVPIMVVASAWARWVSAGSRAARTCRSPGPASPPSAAEPAAEQARPGRPAAWQGAAVRPAAAIIRRFTRQSPPQPQPRHSSQVSTRRLTQDGLPASPAPTSLGPAAADTGRGRISESHLLPVLPPALLALADGTVFQGISIGAAGQTVGEVVFNTALTGYQEILTDPSYCRQIVTLTYPHIGNYGVNAEDVEARKVHAAGLVIRDLPPRVSNFRQSLDLADYLVREGTVAIANIDTRQLTRVLRSTGAQNGCIVSFAPGAQVTAADIAAAVAAARGAPSMAGLDLAQVVSVDQPYPWTETEWALGSGYGQQQDARFHVVAYDYGVKHNILRMLASRGCRITVVPARMPAADVLALRPDGIFLSNGPGDPEPCDYAITATRTLIDSGIPTFGICLGHQIMALASGARTFKMKFGHHGANHPVKDLDTGRVSITSQNHGFAVDATTLPANLRPTHVSLFDGTLQGLARTDKPAFCFQGHPEASPGPHDIAYLFDRFISLMTQGAYPQPSTPAAAGTHNTAENNNA